MKAPFVRSAAALFVVAVASSAGCMAPPGARVQASLHSFQREQSPERLLSRGRAFAAVGDTTRAQEYFKAALDAGADDREVTPGLVSVCVRDGRYRLAVEYAQNFLLRHPGDFGMRFVLGTLLLALGEASAAETELRRVVLAAPQNPNAHYALAVVLRQRSAAPRAWEPHFRTYLRLSPDGEHAEEARSAMSVGAP